MSPACCKADAAAGGGAGLAGLLSQVADKAAAACPWLAVGLVATVLLQEVKLPRAALRRHLSIAPPSASVARSGGSDASGGSSLIRLCAVAALLGLVTPLCSCGAIPLAAALAHQGASPAAVVAFLTAAQSAGLDSAAITVGVLGWSTAAFRLTGALLMAVAAGVAVGHGTGVAAVSNRDCGHDEEVVAGRTRAQKKKKAKTQANEARTAWTRCQAAYSLLDEIWPMLALGIFVSVLVERHWGAADLVPTHQQDRLHQTSAEDEAYEPQPDWWDEEEDGPYPEPPALAPSATAADASSFAVMLYDFAARAVIVAGALPFQLCEHGVVSFASALRKAGASHGTAHAFLLAAPATNVGTLGAVLQASRGRDKLAPLRSAAAISAVAIALSYFLDSSDVLPAAALEAATETLVLPDWWSVVSVWVLGGMVFYSSLGRFRRPRMP